MRKAIVFELRPLDAIVEHNLEDSGAAPSGDLTSLRAGAIAAAKGASGSKKSRVATVFERSQIIRDYVFARAKGSCEQCDEQAPFVTASGIPFLEVHRIGRLSDGGPDDARYMIGVCPNCHRRAHYGADAADQNRNILEYVMRIEGD